MKKNSCSLRGFVTLAVLASLVTLPAPAAFSADGDSSRRVTTGKGPAPGFPLPGAHDPAPGGPTPAPAPSVERHRRPPVALERHRDQRYHDNWRWEHKERREWDWHRHNWHHGRVYRSPPYGAFTFMFGGAPFFYYSGTYYRHTDAGYVVVEAPIGARIRVLPNDCTSIFTEGVRYYVCHDIYYQEAGDEFVVVEGPPAGYPLPEAEIGEAVVVTADSLNLRSGPDRSYRVLSLLYRDEVVEVSGKEREWYYVRTNRGSYGWIMKDHARLYRPRPN